MGSSDIMSTWVARPVDPVKGRPAAVHTCRAGSGGDARFKARGAVTACPEAADRPAFRK
jgi:hypothetical protein